MAIIHYMAKVKPAATRRVGRPSRKDQGLAPTRNVTAKLEEEVIAAIYEKFPSMAEALRFAAKHGDNRAA